MRWILFVFLILGCSVVSQNAGFPGYLVLSFSGLSADEFDEAITLEQIPHIEALIKESIKFTHAYTTSTMESAAMASILTGLYPWEHGIRNNGASVYNSNIKTLPESLRKKGYSSFFISGGAPFLRKSAVSFGFDEFDDRFKKSNYYLSSDEVSSKAVVALKERPVARPSIGVVYFSDFLYFEMQNKEKKLQQFDAAVYKIIKYLKSVNLWDSTTVILVGLRGSQRLPYLYDSVTRIPLFIKPSSKPRDLMPSWKVDGHLTLADLGKTLFTATRAKDVNESLFAVADFSQALEAKEVNFENRMLYAESTPLAWKNIGPHYFLIRSEEWTYFPVEKKLFNTYTDRFQTNNLFGREKLALKNLEKGFLKLQPYKNTSQSKEDSFLISYKLNVAKVLFDPIVPHSEKVWLINQGLGYSKIDNQVKSWFLDYILESKDKNLSEQIDKIEINNNVCKQQAEWVKTKSLKAMERKILKQCSDPETLTWLQSYIHFKEGKKREARILYDVALLLTQRRRDIEFLSKTNWLNGLTWDFSSELPAGASNFTKFLKEVEGTDFVEFTKQRPSF